ncbi:MAG: CopG family transcriptional regulator, partial [Bauldia sp.]
MQIQFTEAQAQALKRAAADRGISVAALAREAVDRLLIESGDSTSRQARERA